MPHVLIWILVSTEIIIYYYYVEIRPFSRIIFSRLYAPIVTLQIVNKRVLLVT